MFIFFSFQNSNLHLLVSSLISNKLWLVVRLIHLGNLAAIIFPSLMKTRRSYKTKTGTSEGQSLLILQVDILLQK